MKLFICSTEIKMDNFSCFQSFVSDCSLGIGLIQRATPKPFKLFCLQLQARAFTVRHRSPVLSLSTCALSAPPSGLQGVRGSSCQSKSSKGKISLGLVEVPSVPEDSTKSEYSRMQAKSQTASAQALKISHWDVSL